MKELEQLQKEFGELIKKMAVIRENEGYSKKYHELNTEQAVLKAKILKLKREKL